MSPSPFAARRSERGFVLVTGLLFLVVLTLLGIAMFRASTGMDRVSANTRDKERSFETAQAALQYGEWWLASGGGGEGDVCTSGIVDGNTAANIHVCSNALGAADALPWANGFSYTPAGLNVSTTPGIVSGTNLDVTYQSAPAFYIERLGIGIDGKSQLYTVSAAGSGGNADTKTVVQSTYQLTPIAKNLGGL